MRKYIIGALFGLVLGLSATAYADELQSLIGKKVQGQTDVYLDGTKLDSAIIVDGKSYAPTRKISEAAGKKVNFKDGGIYLDTPVEVTTTEQPEQNSETETEMTLEQVNHQIGKIEGEIEVMKIGLEEMKKTGDTDNFNKLSQTLKEWEEKLAALIEKKAELEGK